MIKEILYKIIDGKPVPKEEMARVELAFNVFEKALYFIEGMKNGGADVYANSARTPFDTIRPLSSARTASDGNQIYEIAASQNIFIIGSIKFDNTFPTSPGQDVALSNGQVYNYNTTEGVFNGNQTQQANKVSFALASADGDVDEAVSSVIAFTVNNIGPFKGNMAFCIAAVPLFFDGFGNAYPYLRVGFRYSQKSQLRFFSAPGNAVFTSGTALAFYDIT